MGPVYAAREWRAWPARARQHAAKYIDLTICTISFVLYQSPRFIAPFNDTSCFPYKFVKMRSSSFSPPKLVFSAGAAFASPDIHRCAVPPLLDHAETHDRTAVCVSFSPEYTSDDDDDARASIVCNIIVDVAPLPLPLFLSPSLADFFFLSLPLLLFLFLSFFSFSNVQKNAP